MNLIEGANWPDSRAIARRDQLSGVQPVECHSVKSEVVLRDGNTHLVQCPGRRTPVFCPSICCSICNNFVQYCVVVLDWMQPFICTDIRVLFLFLSLRMLSSCVAFLSSRCLANFLFPHADSLTSCQSVPCLICVAFQYRQFSRLPRLTPSSSAWLFVCLVIPVLLVSVIG